MKKQARLESIVRGSPAAVPLRSEALARLTATLHRRRTEEIDSQDKINRNKKQKAVW